LRFPSTAEANDPGVYTAEQLTTKNAETVTDKFFVRIPRDESDFEFIGQILKAPMFEGDAYEAPDLPYDLLIILASVLLAVIIIEWGLQYREQY
jgi:hypothetical protein